MAHSETTSGRLVEAHRSHERRWRDNRYVYGVVSRRSRGLSIGINLNPGRECDFDCVYCQVDRRGSRPPGVDFALLERELDGILRAERDGSLYADPPFSLLDAAERGVRDLAFSGDGEPTLHPRLAEAVRIAGAARTRFGLDAARLVLLTNAGRLDRPDVGAALAALYAHGGEVWAKLDAGFEAWFRRVNRARAPLGRVLENILGAARDRPLVIQSLWMRLGSAGPPPGEIEAWCGRIGDIVAGGGRIRAVHLYTVARSPADRAVSPLGPRDLEAIAAVLRASVPVTVEIFP